jgi:hypothetical protein
MLESDSELKPRKGNLKSLLYQVKKGIDKDNFGWITE